MSGHGSKASKPSPSTSMSKHSRCSRDSTAASVVVIQMGEVPCAFLLMKQVNGAECLFEIMNRKLN